MSATGNPRYRNIDSVDDAAREEITMSNLVIVSRTAASKVSGSGENRKVAYRTGLITPLGNIESECWKQLALQAVTTELGEEFLSKMRSFLQMKGSAAEKADVDEAALSACVSRTYTDARWSHFEAWQRWGA